MGSIQPPHDCSGNLDKKEKLHGNVQGWRMKQRWKSTALPSRQNTFSLQDVEEAEPGTSQVRPKPSLQSDTFLCWIIWQLKRDLEAQQLLKDLWCWDCPAGECWVPTGVSWPGHSSLRSCSALSCPSHGWKRWNLSVEISRAGAGITSSLRQQGLLGAVDCSSKNEINLTSTGLCSTKGVLRRLQGAVCLGSLSTGKNPHPLRLWPLELGRSDSIRPDQGVDWPWMLMLFNFQTCECCCKLGTLFDSLLKGTYDYYSIWTQESVKNKSSIWGNIW